MERVLQVSMIQWFLLILPAGEITAQKLLTDKNPSGDFTINNLKLAAYVTHIPINKPLVDPLDHIYTRFDNMAEFG